ncbi:hypothetical protein [Inquilinus limosus]|uniref:Uncharacterized protein n=1 Tax=Inquilinus limosus MP06 TaxID=1398085 RepID=A0A0A0D0H7_9PROT|nr:hypothetical protein [Inquilinus limosus]KGM31565.1 hypothetical protein P409_26475 [Inquilinus limosus MP06]
MSRWGIVLTAAAVLGGPAAATAEDASVMCLYSMVNGARAMLIHCGEPLDDQHEQKYVLLNQALEDFIRANGGAIADRIIAHEGPQGSLEHVRKRGQDSCRSRDYPGWKQFITKLLDDPAATDSIKEQLKTPRDPRQGGCL